MSCICVFLQSFPVHPCSEVFTQRSRLTNIAVSDNPTDSRPVTLLILSRLPEGQGRTAVSQKDTLIFISHAADI